MDREEWAKLVIIDVVLVSKSFALILTLISKCLLACADLALALAQGNHCYG